MNQAEAEHIIEQYQKLLQCIDLSKLKPPSSQRAWSVPKLNAIGISDGMIVAHWSTYVGCGEYEDDSTYHTPAELFQEKA